MLGAVSLGLGCATEPAQQQLLGADRDSHGCIASAGYVWSGAAQACVRLWESGIALRACAPEASDVAAYVVLSADGTEAEVFLPVKTAPLVLARSFTPEGPCWAQPDGKWRLLRLPEGWRLLERGKPVYQAPNPPAAH